MGNTKTNCYPYQIGQKIYPYQIHVKKIMECSHKIFSTFFFRISVVAIKYFLPSPFFLSAAAIKYFLPSSFGFLLQLKTFHAFFFCQQVVSVIFCPANLGTDIVLSSVAREITFKWGSPRHICKLQC